MRLLLLVVAAAYSSKQAERAKPAESAKLVAYQDLVGCGDRRGASSRESRALARG